MSTTPAGNGETDGKQKTLPPRQPTFLARYPRKTKIIALIVLVAAIAALCCSRQLFKESALLIAKTERIEKNIHGSEKEAARPNGREDLINNPIVTANNGNEKAQEILNDQDDHSIKMAAAPDMELSEDSSEGSLPRVSEDGRQPWQVYARPFNTADKRPRIAIVIVDLGLSRVETDAAINRLPANVTLAFDVQSPVVGAWCGRARQDGHETLLMVPMEPFDYPRSDPGPNALLTTLPNSDNLGRLYWALRQSAGYVGITTLSGSRFTTDPDKLSPVLDVLRKRGLMIFDAHVAPHSAIMDMARNMHVPAVMATSRIDQNPSPEAIDTALDQLEKTARLTGRAVGIASPLPVVMDRLQVWFKNLPQHGIALAPVSAMVQ